MHTRFPVVFMYPGQGSQYYGMCRELFEEEPVFRSEMLRCAEITRDMVRDPLAEVIYGRRASEEFRDTAYSSFAILAVEWSLTRLLATRGIYPAMTLGYSLGEYAAAACAGVISLENAYDMLHEQVRVLRSMCRPGGLIGILGDERTVASVLAQHPTVSIAAFNGPDHVTLSGSSDAIRQIHESFRHRPDIISEILPVEYSYHSADLDPMEAHFLRFLSSTTLQRSALPFFSCASSGEMRHDSPEHFWSVLRQPVLFENTVRAIEEKSHCTFVDVGPRGTLATLAKRFGRSKDRVYAAISPFGRNTRSLELLEAALR